VKTPQDSIFSISYQHGKADKPTVIFEATGSPDVPKITFRFSYIPTNKSRVYHIYEIDAAGQDMEFLLSMLCNGNCLDPKHGITWQDGILRILKLNRQDIQEDVPRRCEFRVRWHEHARSLAVRPTKIHQDEELQQIEFRLSPAESDRLVMLIKRVVRMAEVLQVEAPAIAALVIEKLVPVFRQQFAATPKG